MAEVMASLRPKVTLLCILDVALKEMMSVSIGYTPF
jgi:hypothetical protein